MSSFDGIVIVMEGSEHTVERGHCDREKLEGTAEGNGDILYVQYTSGSSGMAKAVQCSHRAVIARCVGYNQELPISTNDKFLVKTAYTTGLFELEILWPLAFGGTMVLLKDGDEVDAKRINAALIKHHCTHVVLPQSQLLSCLTASDEFRLSRATSLQYLMQCGEKLTWQCVLEAAKKTSCNTTLYNMYGALESSVSVWPTPKDIGVIECAMADGQPVPVGKAIAMCQWHVLQFGSLEPVADGSNGEICCSGAIADGYLNDSDLTAKSFVAAYPRIGETLYRTGDVGRFDGDNLVVFGRRDRQVKVNGQRIELDEVENSIELCGSKLGIKIERAAAVIGEKMGNAAVVVYVVVSDAADCGALKDAMGQVVPKDSARPKLVMVCWYVIVMFTQSARWRPKHSCRQ